jgi:hypothetical protein
MATTASTPPSTGDREIRQRSSATHSFGANGRLWFGPAGAPDSGRNQRHSLLDALKTELAAAIALAAAMLVATGWLVTWAKLASEGIPSASILGSLPQTYFIQVGLLSMITPAVVVLCVAGIWVPTTAMMRDRCHWAVWAAAWGLFSVLVSWASFAIITQVSDRGLRSSSSYHVAWVVTNLGAGIFGAGLGLLGQAYLNRRWQPQTPRLAWAKVRPLVALTIVICITVICAVRTIDARFAANALPVAQVVLQPPCTRSSGASIPCVDSGFYLGETSSWIFLGQPRNPCRQRDAGPARLFEVAKSEVRGLRVFPRSDVTCANLYRRAPR